MDRVRLLEAIEDSIRFSFARSGGPGGQNVNKRSTKATARLALTAIGLSDTQLERVRARLATRVNAADEIVVQVSDERQQMANRKAAVARVAALVEGALRVARKRRPTRPSASSRERRLESKRHRAVTKRQRGELE
jgi:ribosome-associated protein